MVKSSGYSAQKRQTQALLRMQGEVLKYIKTIYYQKHNMQFTMYDVTQGRNDDNNIKTEGI